METYEEQWENIWNLLNNKKLESIEQGVVFLQMLGLIENLKIRREKSMWKSRTFDDHIFNFECSNKDLFLYLEERNKQRHYHRDPRMDFLMCGRLYVTIKLPIEYGNIWKVNAKYTVSVSHSVIANDKKQASNRFHRTIKKNDFLSIAHALHNVANEPVLKSVEFEEQDPKCGNNGSTK